MGFKEFILTLETQTLQIDKPVSGSGFNDNNDGFDDGGNNDDDEFWEWDKLKRFDQGLMTWTNTSDFARKIKTSIINLVFKQQPEIDFKEYIPYDEENEFEFSPSGEITMSVEWKYPEDNLEERLYNTLRSSQSDLWKPLGIRPNEVWNTLDKGDLFEYVWYHLKSSILGQNVEYSNTMYHPEKPDGQRFDQQYFGMQKKWEEDKPTFEKYTKYVLFERAKEFEEKAREFIPFDVELEKIKESVKALVWQNNFDASAYIWYRYNKV